MYLYLMKNQTGSLPGICNVKLKIVSESYIENVSLTSE